MTKKVSKKDMPCNKPKATPSHPKKSHIVKACEDGDERIIRFGEQGAETAGKPKDGESEEMKQKRASFKARHAANIAKGKMSGSYWADRTKWVLLAAALWSFTGCVEPPKPTPKPPVVRPTQDFKGIVLVSMNGCGWCTKQKKVLDAMGVQYITVNHSEDASARQKYPAKAYPTMYIYFNSKPTQPVEGFKSREELERIIR